MFVWMILAVMIAALFSFLIAPRDDDYEVRHVPRAEGIAANLATMHSAATRYVFDNLGSYSSGLIGAGTLGSYLPLGYSNSYNVQSEIFCFDTTNTDTRIQIDCDDANAKNYVISYIPTPPRFTMMNGENQPKPNRAMMLALAKTGSNAINIGYTVNMGTDVATSDCLGSRMGVQSYRGVFVYIPQGAQSIDSHGGDIGFNYLVYVTRLANSGVDLNAPI